MNERSSAWLAILALLRKEDITELEVVDRSNVWVSCAGSRQRIPNLSWRSIDEFFNDFDDHVKQYMNAPGYADVRKCNTIYEGGLTVPGDDGGYHARLHMILPPTTVFPQVTIAKRSESLTSLESMVMRGSMTKEMERFIRLIVRKRQTIVFSGGGGSGKTTMLRACCNYLGKNERVVVCEDTPELSLPISNVSYLESTPWRPGIDRNMEVTLEYLVAQANRMRCDRIIVGETRSKEFHGFLQSANSGYSGSMTTLHANSPEECVEKMGTLDLEAMQSGDRQTVNRGIADAVDFIIQLRLLPGGRHVVDEIYSLSNSVADADGKISGATIFKYLPEKQTFENDVFSLEDRKRQILGIVRNEIPDDDIAPSMAERTGRDGIRTGLPVHHRRAFDPSRTI